MPPLSPISTRREAALPHVIARAQHQSLIHGLVSRPEVLMPVARAGIDIREDQVFLEGGRAERSPRPRHSSQSCAVEHQLIVAANLVHLHHGHAVALGLGRQHFAAEARACPCERATH